MSTEPRFETYLFFRAEGFYPVQITKESAPANIACNPGTLKVEACAGDLSGQNKVIWTQADGWLDAEYAAIAKAEGGIMSKRSRQKRQKPGRDYPWPWEE